jgi:hypothetical protein
MGSPAGAPVSFVDENLVGSGITSDSILHQTLQEHLWFRSPNGERATNFEYAEHLYHQETKMMPKSSSTARLHLCEIRSAVPGGSAHERQLDRERTLHQEGPFLIKSELDRIKPQPVPDSLVGRILQAIDVLLGRRQVFVERRGPLR